METSNKPKQSMIGVLYFSNMMLVFSLSEKLMKHSHGTMDFIVDGTICVIIALIITATLSRYFSKMVIVAAIPVTLLLAILVSFF